MTFFTDEKGEIGRCSRRNCASATQTTGRAHSADEYIVIEGNDKVAGIVRAEQSYVDVLYAFANWPA